jgi:hypothetical protein
MKAGRFTLPAVLLMAVACSFWTTANLYSLHKERQNQIISRLIYLPQAVLEAASLEFSGVLSDYLMLKTMVFHGERLMLKQSLSPEEWQATHLAISRITDLDPRFWDPYVFAETSFPWDAGMVKETNELLLKAAQARTNDYQPYFFLWFNYSHFLKDETTAAKYLEKSSRIPSAPVYFATLAARANFSANKTENAVVFLEEILKETTDPTRQAWIMKRQEALKVIAFLETHVRRFEEKFSRRPKDLQELVDMQVLVKIPPDPYGGTFFITPEGRVYTTSKLVPMQ